MAVIKDYYRNTKDFMQCTGLSKKDLHDIACRYSISLPGVTFDYPKYYVPEHLSICDCLVFLLYSGGYGSFPVPSSPPNSLSNREKKILDLDYDAWDESYAKLLDEYCFDDSFCFTVDAFEFSMNYPGLNYIELYSAVWFLLCFREELVKANYSKRGINYKSLINFETPVYYRNNIWLEPWVDNNNVLMACLRSIMDAVYLFLWCTFFFNKEENYSFICSSLSEADSKRLLPGYNCIASTRTEQTVYTILEHLLYMLEYWDCVIRRIPVNQSQPKSFWSLFFKPSLNELVKKIFDKISKMESYIRYI